MLLLKSLNPSLYTNKQQNIKTFRYDWKLVDRNCPEYGMCPVYGELGLIILTGQFIRLLNCMIAFCLNICSENISFLSDIPITSQSL